MAKLSLSDLPSANVQGAVAQRSGVRAPQTSHTSLHTSMRLALALIAELSACLHMVTRDIARSKDLEMAPLRWDERLTALMRAIEQVVHRDGAERPRPEYPSPSSSISSASSSQQAHSGTLKTLTSHADHRLRLTSREREVMELARRGYPPRKIAKRLQLSVQTVYTHLRNARRKQLW